MALTKHSMGIIIENLSELMINNGYEFDDSNGFLESFCELPDIKRILSLNMVPHAYELGETDIASNSVVYNTPANMNEIKVDGFILYKMNSKNIVGKVIEIKDRNFRIRKLGYNGKEMSIVSSKLYDINLLDNCDDDIEKLYVYFDVYYVSNITHNNGIFVCDIISTFEEESWKTIAHVYGTTLPDGSYSFEIQVINEKENEYSMLYNNCNEWINMYGISTEDETMNVELWLEYMIFFVGSCSPKDFFMMKIKNE